MAEATFDFPIRKSHSVDMGAVTTAHKGDLLVWSGGVPVLGAIPAGGLTAYAKQSAIGYAGQDHPEWTPQGSGVINTAMPIVKEGVVRVSSVGNVSAGYWAWQITPGSGRVGQTGATGVGPVWSATAGAPSISALGGDATSGSAISTSAFGRVERVHSAGNTGQIDVSLFNVDIIAHLNGGTRQV